ncbi:MAG: Hsp20/alpha crystallin family protein [Bacteroidota bacterium]|nr:Hsp20/alpha crystallin family protein [Bacteroidota bacterium]
MKEDLAMTLKKYENKMFPSFPSFLDRFFEGNLMDWNLSNFAELDSTLPAVNVRENDNEVVIELAAPGMKKSDFNVNYDNGRLTISSEKKDEKTEKEGEKISRQEFNYQSFQRSFNVPENMVDTDKINAKYSDGILHVTLPKREEAKPRPSKEIKIS